VQNHRPIEQAGGWPKKVQKNCWID